MRKEDGTKVAVLVWASLERLWPSVLREDHGKRGGWGGEAVGGLGVIQGQKSQDSSRSKIRKLQAIPWMMRKVAGRRWRMRWWLNQLIAPSQKARKRRKAETTGRPHSMPARFDDHPCRDWPSCLDVALFRCRMLIGRGWHGPASTRGETIQELPRPIGR